MISNWKPHKLWNARLMFPNIPKRRFIIIILSDTLNPGQSHHISQLAMNADNSNSNFDNTIEEEIADALNRSAIGNFCALLSIFRLVAENVLPILRNSNINHNIQVDTLAHARVILITCQFEKSNTFRHSADADDAGPEGMEVEVGAVEEEQLLGPAGTPDYSGINAGSRPVTPLHQPPYRFCPSPRYHCHPRHSQAERRRCWGFVGQWCAKTERFRQVFAERQR